ncbi:MAG: YfiR family protein, partial [Bacteroidota bacterium]
MLYKRVLVLPFVVLTCFLSFSQGSQSSIDQTLNFAKLVEWPSYQEAFKVHVITRNSDIKLAFQSLEKTDKLKGKAIDVSTTTYAVVPKNVNLIFISKQYNAAIPAILGRIGDKPILLVTEAYGEQQNVMFNIVPSAGSFEYNPANISLQGLKLSGDPKSLGGREISLLDLYQKVRDSIRSVQLEAPSQEQMVDSLNINMAVARRLIRFQLDSIDQQKKKIEQGDRRLQIQGSRLDSLSKQV